MSKMCETTQSVSTREDMLDVIEGNLRTKAAMCESLGGWAVNMQLCLPPDLARELARVIARGRKAGSAVEHGLCVDPAGTGEHGLCASAGDRPEGARGLLARVVAWRDGLALVGVLALSLGFAFPWALLGLLRWAAW